MIWVVSEAGRNIWSGTVASLRWSLVACVLWGGGAALESASLGSILDTSADYRRSRASVVVLEAAGAIDGDACEALSVRDDIQGSGAVRDMGPLVAPSLPNGPLAAYAVTPGVLEVVAAGIPVGDGVFVSRAAAEQMGWSVGDRIILSGGSGTVGAIYDWPSDGRRSGFGYAVLIPHEDDVFDDCWVDSSPASARLSLLGQFVVRRDGGPASDVLEMSRLNNSRGPDSGARGAFLSRPSRHVGVLLSVVSVVLGWASVVTRRLELALLLHLGAPRRSLIAQVGAEVASWLLPAAAVATAVGLCVSAPLVPGELGVVSRAVLAILLPGALAVLGGATAGLLSVSGTSLQWYARSR